MFRRKIGRSLTRIHADSPYEQRDCIKRIGFELDIQVCKQNEPANVSSAPVLMYRYMGHDKRQKAAKHASPNSVMKLAYTLMVKVFAGGLARPLISAFGMPPCASYQRRAPAISGTYRVGDVVCAPSEQEMIPVVFPRPHGCEHMEDSCAH